MLTPDTVLQNRYRIMRPLGKGGMGAVYEALDARLGAPVALKETLFAEEALRLQFEREARLLARLHHPALPRVSDHFEESGGQFLVMQFIPGDDLEALRKARGGTLAPDDVVGWCDQLLDALDYLHTQEPAVVHRDIKPQNLKLSGRGQIILLDFGLAKGLADSTASRAAAHSSVHGYTRGYAPLEQIEGTGTDPRSDLYSLAATAYHLLTGRMPPDALTRASAVLNGGADPLLPMRELNAQIPEGVSAVLQGALALRSDQRPRSAADMRAALRAALHAVPFASATPGAGAEADTVLYPPQGETELDVAASEPKADAGAKGLTDAQRHHLEYWMAFKSFVERRGSLLIPTKPLPQYWMDVFPFGRAGFKLVASDGLRDKWIGVDLTLSGSDAGAHFRRLLREKERIEREAGTPLEWREKQGQKWRYVTLRQEGTDPSDRSDWPRQHAWLLDRLELFRFVFAPRVMGHFAEAEDAAQDADSPSRAEPHGVVGAQPTSPVGAAETNAPHVRPRRLAGLSSRALVFAAVLVLGVGAALFYYRISPAYFRVRSVSVEGASRADRGDIEATVLRYADGRPIWEVSTGAVANALERVPWVRRAEVSRDWPDGLKVRVTEREPRVIARSSSGRLVWVDDDGVLLGLAQPGAQDFFIRGIDEADSELARNENRARVATALALKGVLDAVGLTERISEIDLSDLQDVRMQLTGKDAAVDVRLGGQDLPKRFRQALEILDEQRRTPRGPYVTYVDLSKGARAIIGTDRTPPRTR